MTTPPAIILHRIRGIAQSAARRGQKLDPQHILDIIGGKKA